MNRRARSARFSSLLPILFVALLAASAPLAAELVITVTGDVIKVASWRLEGERFHLELPEGGRLELPLLRVERIVDDEIPLESPPALEPAPRFALHFRAGEDVADAPFAALILRTAREQDLNPRLLRAMIEVESAFRIDAVSPKGARGLLQLMPATALRFGVAPDELFDPARNLYAGGRYVAWLRERFDDRLPLVLAAYNAGEGAVDRYDGVPPYSETRRYLERVYASLGLSSEVSSR